MEDDIADPEFVEDPGPLRHDVLRAHVGLLPSHVCHDPTSRRIH